MKKAPGSLSGATWGFGRLTAPKIASRQRDSAWLVLALHRLIVIVIVGPALLHFRQSHPSDGDHFGADVGADASSPCHLAGD